MRHKSSRLLALTLVAGTVLGLESVRAQQSPSTQPAGVATPAQSSILGFTTRAPLPNVFDPYFSPAVPAPPLSNSERLHALIQNGKLELSLEDAIALALENNLDIAYARYQLPLAQADYLRARAGGATRGVSGAFQSSALFAGAVGAGVSGGGSGGTGGAGGITGGGSATNLGFTGCCDPFAGFSVGWDQRTSPLNTLIVSGIPVINSHNASYSTFFGQGFLTGTSYVMALNSFRQASNQQNLLFNPEVPAFFGFTLTQHILRGFGYRANATFIRIGKNDLRISDSVFRQQVITVVAQVVNLYSDLLNFQENVRVAQEALNYAQKLLSDNKKQVEIGTLAPIEVVRAESEVAARQQDLIVAQTSYQQQQEVLKTAISKHVDAELAGVQIEATDKLPEPKPDDIPPLAEALREAVKNRPEIEQVDLNLRNQEITIQSTRNGLLPTLDMFASYAPVGLSGNRLLFGRCPTGFTPISAGGQCVSPGLQSIPQPIAGVQQAGAFQSLTQVLHNQFPDYSFGVSLQIPVRNRVAQADAATALLQERQFRTQLQQRKNQVEQDVRSAEIGVTQAKAQIEAAVKATRLARETLDAEQKKFQLGESTVFLVIQAQRDLATAEGNEVKAQATYAKALTQFQQATATILDTYRIQFADAKEGRVSRPPNIPGTPEPAASQK